MNHTFTRLSIGFLFSCILLTSCKNTPETVVHKDIDVFTLEDQQDIAKNLSALIETNSDYYHILKEEDYPRFYEYINTILNTIVNTSNVENRTTFDWEVIILKDNEMRSAFTIPGGKIYIYTGLLKMLEGENELFSILAHELYYSDKAAVIDAMTDEYGSFILGDLVIGTHSEGALDIAQTIGSMAYSEELVSKADAFALELVCPFQYEARGLISFIERAMSMSDEVIWLSNHPSTPNRLSLIEMQAQGCGEEEHTFSERYEYNRNLLP